MIELIFLAVFLIAVIWPIFELAKRITDNEEAAKRGDYDDSILSDFLPRNRRMDNSVLEALLTDGIESKNLMPLETFDNFTCGQFNGTIQRQLRNEQGIPYKLSPAHVFKIMLPPVEDMVASIKLSESDWKCLLEGTPQDLHTLANWNIPSDELKNVLYKTNSPGLKALYELFKLGPGVVQCQDNEFTVTLFNIKQLDDTVFTNDFWMAARKIFWIYARVAGLNLNTWRVPELNFDWWAYDLWVDDKENQSNKTRLNDEL